MARPERLELPWKSAPPGHSSPTAMLGLRLAVPSAREALSGGSAKWPQLRRYPELATCCSCERRGTITGSLRGDVVTQREDPRPSRDRRIDPPSCG